MVFWDGEIRLVASEGYHQNGGLLMTKLDMLNAQRAEKFAALCALVAHDLGYGELEYLSEEDRNHIEGEAKPLCGAVVENQSLDSPDDAFTTPLG